MHAAPVRLAPARGGLLLVTCAATLWGTVGVAGQLLYDRTGLDPVAVGWYRLAVAAVIVCALARLAGQVVFPERTLRARAAFVGVGLAGYQVCYFAAVDRIGVSIATLVTLGLAPILVSAGAAVVLGDRHGPRTLVALAVALAGLGLIVGAPAPDGADVAAGLLLAVGSAGGYAAVTLATRSLASGGADPAALGRAGFATGALVLTPVALAGGVGVEADAGTLALLLYLGAIPTALAYTLFFRGLKTAKPTAASILSLLEPLTATVLAALVFGERLGLAVLAGGALLLGAVLLLYAETAGEAR